MSLDTLIIFSGAVVAIMPFLGFPVSWDHAVFFFAGILVLILGIAARRRLSQKPNSVIDVEMDVVDMGEDNAEL